MKEYSCPDCRTVIAHDDMNIKEGVAVCSRCGKISKLIDLVEEFDSADYSRLLYEKPPRGIKLVRDKMNPMGELTLIYKRINPAVLFLIPFTAIWSGFSMFGIYIGPFLKDDKIPLEQALMGIPFAIGTIILLVSIFSMLFGKRILTLSNGKGTYAFKVFGIGRTKHFELNRSTRIENSETNYQVHNNTLPQITIINGSKRVNMFASFRYDAMDYIIALLRSVAR